MNFEKRGGKMTDIDEFEFDNGDKFNFKLALILSKIVHENTCQCCPHDIGIKLAREADKFYRCESEGE